MGSADWSQVYPGRRDRRSKRRAGGSGRSSPKTNESSIYEEQKRGLAIGSAGHMATESCSVRLRSFLLGRTDGANKAVREDSIIFVVGDPREAARMINTTRDAPITGCDVCHVKSTVT